MQNVYSILPSELSYCPNTGQRACVKPSYDPQLAKHTLQHVNTVNSLRYGLGAYGRHNKIVNGVPILYQVLSSIIEIGITSSIYECDVHPATSLETYRFVGTVIRHYRVMG